MAFPPVHSLLYLSESAAVPSRECLRTGESRDALSWVSSQDVRLRGRIRKPLPSVESVGCELWPGQNRFNCTVTKECNSSEHDAHGEDDERRRVNITLIHSQRAQDLVLRTWHGKSPPPLRRPPPLQPPPTSHTTNFQIPISNPNLKSPRSGSRPEPLQIYSVWTVDPYKEYHPSTFGTRFSYHPLHLLSSRNDYRCFASLPQRSKATSFLRLPSVFGRQSHRRPSLLPKTFIVRVTYPCKPHLNLHHIFTAQRNDVSLGILTTARRDGSHHPTVPISPWVNRYSSNPREGQRISASSQTCIFLYIP